MGYVCGQCGECCSVMGQVFTLTGKQDEFRFTLRNTYTGDIHVVEVTPCFRELFLQSAIPAEWTNPCPFLRHDHTPALAFCTVHETRPEICRDFECWRMLVLDHNGRRVARVMGQRYLCLDDEGLRDIWEVFRENHDPRDDAEWESLVFRFFTERGYIVRV